MLFQSKKVLMNSKLCEYRKSCMQVNYGQIDESCDKNLTAEGEDLAALKEATAKLTAEFSKSNEKQKTMDRSIFNK